MRRAEIHYKDQPEALRWINQSFLTDIFKEKYILVLEERYAILIAD